MNTEQKLDLKQYEFQSVTAVDLAFSTLKTDPVLLDEAERRGFGNWNHPYCRLFSKLFFSGGRVVFKPDVPEDYRVKVWRYLQAFMRSWEPKHEHKEAISAMLLSEICEPETKE